MPMKICKLLRYWIYSEISTAFTHLFKWMPRPLQTIMYTHKQFVCFQFSDSCAMRISIGNANWIQLKNEAFAVLQTRPCIYMAKVINPMHSIIVTAPVHLTAAQRHRSMAIQSTSFDHFIFHLPIIEHSHE